ncbi:MAG: pyruvate formate lyase family protein [Actinomycetia bacterium]|nr:pyruvate formate lyase family protein [Actinomycetes bacterium]
MYENFIYKERIKNLVKKKEEHTRIKWERLKTKSSTSGKMAAMDTDDKGMIPPPLDFNFKLIPNHPSGGIFGPKACGLNFRRLLENHPVYIDKNSSLAGGYMFVFWEMSNPFKDRGVWNPDFSYENLHEDQKNYGIIDGIGAPHHFSQDINIGFKLGWRGILDKIRHYREKNSSESIDFYDALENVVIGIQNWIERHAVEAERMAKIEQKQDLKENLIEIARVNRKLINEPPETFHEAVQWFAWFIMTALMYNGGAAAGAIDVFLKPYYDRDKAKGILSDDEAVYHLACLLVKDNEYYQIGGTDIYGNDVTNSISFLLLEAAHLLKIPTNIYLRVHEKQNTKLLKRAVEILFEDGTGSPNFISDENINKGFMKNGYSIELARQREKNGCHWCAIPGREYTMNDVVKVNFASVFNFALKEMMNDQKELPSTEKLWNLFIKHLEKAISTIAKGIDFHLEHMHEVFPELVIDLLCHGTIEKGLDATHGGVEFYNMCVDGAGLATVADSLAALEQRIEKEKCISWKELYSCLDNNFKDTEHIRLLLKNIPRYGKGQTRADEFALNISKSFAKLVKEKPTPNGFIMIPGIFSWAFTISYGLTTTATPNGRFSGDPISHGANPDPGTNGPESITALAIAVASVQSGYGNTVPLQLDVDPLLGRGDKAINSFIAFIKGYYDLGGTLLNVNILDKKKILDANEDPFKYPDLIVRVTGFSAYFASLSKEWRQLVVNRIMESA